MGSQTRVVQIHPQVSAQVLDTMTRDYISQHKTHFCNSDSNPETQAPLPEYRGWAPGALVMLTL